MGGYFTTYDIDDMETDEIVEEINSFVRDAYVFRKENEKLRKALKQIRHICTYCVHEGHGNEIETVARAALEGTQSETAS